MRVVRAAAMGMCFGVRDALEIAGEQRRPASITVLGELVHNETVLRELDDRGFVQVPETSREAVPLTPEVLITAHGVSQRERRRLEGAGKRLIDTTCPLVRHVHEVAQELERDGYHVLVVGKPSHVEVRGIVGDLEHFTVVEQAGDVVTYDAPRLGVVFQTTTRPEVADSLVDTIRERNAGKEVRVVDTICSPTRARQEAVVELLEKVDAVVVVGGRNSNNTRQLLQVAASRGVPALHVQGAQDLDPEWFEGVDVVGLTAGTSTLDSTIDAVYRGLLAIEQPQSGGVVSA